MIKKTQFIKLIDQGDFKELFVSELGWNRFRGQTELPVVAVDDKEYHIYAIAEKNGFQVLTCEVDEIPTQSVARKIDTKLRRQAQDYICIYRLRGTDHDLWVVPVRTNEKRDLVLIEYETAEKAELLYSKIEGFSFALDEETNIVDIRTKVHGAFAINSERITKDFYAGFKKEHKAFAEFITGIDDHITASTNKNKQWYTSVMLNRLMFCYFIQKKGFLNLDVDYLRHKLNWVRQEQGENHFFQSFYRGFLSNLFHDGLNMPNHDREFERMYGKIPYLNGGMFEEHQLEREYADIDIADEAFIRLFNFFDKWRWHLDTRITASGKDINPDVLGYIFEQYINDRAQMGAYYTKEDITEYIGRNCILPFLFDETKRSANDEGGYFSQDGYVWKALKESGDKYIFDAVKKGYAEFDKIPENIKKGIITEDMRHEYSEIPVGQLPEGHIQLSELRADWNTRTPETWGLPTEIWRETIERLERCGDILTKIKSGEINSINDFITYNLDIRTFAHDLLTNGDSRFVGRFYKALQRVTILDPTCGSGAFLFAAMNILEPLYEICIERMQAFNAEKPNLFKEELAEITNKYRSNIQYFIFKSIILRNLYGVDIMVEATEIAKLRLFLKMVAVVDVDKRMDNLGLDPLPDIDFNIRCGNTLVGYANEKQLDADLSTASNILEDLANQEFKEKIDIEMKKVAMVYDRFRKLQLVQEMNMADFKQAKEDLRERLKRLNDLLNNRLFEAAGQRDYNEWLSSHQPFNWLAEFYQIIHDHGGFDVIIGNPPYVEYSKVRSTYHISNYETEYCGNLYAFVMERSKSISSSSSYMGMIVPMSGHSTERMSSLVKSVYQSYSFRILLNLSADANPQRLFEGVKFRLCIFFLNHIHKGQFSSKYTRWLAEERKDLFAIAPKYYNDPNYRYENIITKIPSKLFFSIVEKIKSEKQFFFNDCGNNKLYYQAAPVNWIRSHSSIPYFKSERDGEGTTLKFINFSNEYKAEIASAITNSSTFFLLWLCHADCYHLNKPEFINFHYSFGNNEDAELCNLSSLLQEDMKAKSVRRTYIYKATGKVEYDEFYMKKSKKIIDAIDTTLAKHYGFTEEELDFIINYDIKYRMGDELNNQEG